MAKLSRIGPALGLFLALCSCVDLRARVYGGYTQTELAGDMGLASSSGPATITGTVDVESLGADQEGSPYARVELGSGILNVTASAFQYDSSGTGTLTADFGDISVGTNVEMDLEFINLKGAVTWDLINFGVVRISPGVAIDYFDLLMEVRVPGVGALERLQMQVPVPMAFAQTEVDLGAVAATVDVGAMAVDYEDVEGTFFDIEGMLRINPTAGFEVFGGYRWISLDGKGTADGQDFDADLDLTGWFVGGGFTF